MKDCKNQTIWGEAFEFKAKAPKPVTANKRDIEIAIRTAHRSGKLPVAKLVKPRQRILIHGPDGDDHFYGSIASHDEWKNIIEVYHAHRYPNDRIVNILYLDLRSVFWDHQEVSPF